MNVPRPSLASPRLIDNSAICPSGLYSNQSDTSVEGLHRLANSSTKFLKYPTDLYPADARVYAQGDDVSSLFYVELGAVRIFRLLADGRRQICAFYLSGEVFGLGDHDRYEFFAESTCVSIIHASPLSELEDPLREMFPIALEDLRRAQLHIVRVGKQSALERVSSFLIEMRGRQGGFLKFELPMSRQDIADYLGITVETASRAFSKLILMGIVSVPTLRGVEIVREQRLFEIAE